MYITIYIWILNIFDLFLRGTLNTCRQHDEESKKQNKKKMKKQKICKKNENSIRMDDRWLCISFSAGRKVAKFNK